MSSTPVLAVDEPDGPVRAIALVLHGGRSKSVAPVRRSQLAVLRMSPFARSLRRGGRGHGLAVARLRFAVRGWNGVQRSPVADALWALDRLGEQFPGVPIALVGHSMGGRTALYAAGHSGVRAVVGLAPWVEPGDAEATVPSLTGLRILFVHGTQDRMTDPDASAQYARAAQPHAESVSYVGVSGEKHAMLRRATLWHDLATGYVLAVLIGAVPDGTGDSATTNVLKKALAGQAALVV